MNGHEKSTYLVFRHGKDPEKLKLGNLVIYPDNPVDDDHHSCLYSLSDLHQWTGEPQTEQSLSIEVQDSRGKHASLNALSFFEAERGRLSTSCMRIAGKNARRFQIDQTPKFLNEMIMNSPGAKDWLNSRITVAKHMYYLNQLKFGSSRHPQIWMVTGVQLLSDVTVEYEESSSKTAGLRFKVPAREMATLAVNFVLADDSMVSGGASASQSKLGKRNVRYTHTNERVWAAQFRRLKVDFLRAGGPGLVPDQKISLKSLLDLGHLGIKGTVPQGVDEASQITGVGEDDAGEMKVAMTETDRELFGKFMTASTSGKRALLIGGAERDLTGVQNDLKVMSDLLLGLRFDISLCYGNMATRDGILHAWGQLIQQTGNGDTVVVYYSGHGSICRSIQYEDLRIQYIIPVDIEQSTKDDFRGILDVELSHLVCALTDRTHNVTIVLDCCHSERAAREPTGSGVRSWSPASAEDIDAHMRRLERSGLHQRRYTEGNPHSVRIVAAEDDQSAYEDKGIGGVEKMGNLTRELVLEIQRIGNTIASWDAVLSQLRNTLDHGRSKSQRPQIEGPKMRVLFSLERLTYFGQLGVKGGMNTLEGPSLMGGSLVGIREGDQYAIMPSTALTVDETRKVADATVNFVYPTSADVTLRFVDGVHEVPEGARAFPVKGFRPGYDVRICVNNELIKTRLHDRIRSALFIHEADSQDKTHIPFATVAEAEGKLVLLCRHDDPLFEYPLPTIPGADHDEAADNAVYQVQKLARADQVLTMVPEEDDILDDSQVSIEIGRVKERRCVQFPDGEKKSFKEDGSAYLKISNNGDYTVFAHAFLLTSIGTIKWLSEGSPSGHELHPKGTPYFPYQTADTYHGRIIITEPINFGWPAWIPRRGPLREAFAVILTSGKADLGFLRTEFRMDA
ncbi:Metacaspase-1 [Cytospora mali]|uniref:Metacaspase-1 n=1 Tax=Cytospora mali TaxID=578113 RepID=A0A194VG74_CYTMA|nr:Metacaspase-1 [Valsa mali var. pyri (nom. inval.)]